MERDSRHAPPHRGVVCSRLGILARDETARLPLLGGAMATWSLAVRAQQRTMPVIGFINPGAPRSSRDYIAAFQHGLSETGYIEGRNVSIEYRRANDQPEVFVMSLARGRV
jgi:hypothetical protein